MGHLRLDRLTSDHIAAGCARSPLGNGPPKRTPRERRSGRAGPAPGRARSRPPTTRYAALAFALRKDQLLHSSPIVAVARPRLDREIDFLKREEAWAFLDAAKTDRYRALWHLLIATGLRWGEVAALRWADVDLEEAALTVRRALKETREFVITKSKGGRRRIDLPPSVVLELRRHRKKKWKPDDLVFRTENGEPLHASNLARRHLFPILACAKLRRIRFHDLRHTATAIRLLAGQHPLVVKKLLGHSSVKTTMDVYGQLQASVSKDAAAQYEAAMKAPKRRRAASPK